MKVRHLLFALAALAAYLTLGLEGHADGKPMQPERILRSADFPVTETDGDAGKGSPSSRGPHAGRRKVRDVRQVESRPSCPKLGKNGMVIEIQAVIDGRDDLVIQGGTIQWRHYDWAIVGRHEPLNEPTILSTRKRNAVTLDRLEWFPEWYDLQGKPVSHYRQPAISSKFNELTPPLPSRDMEVLLTPINCRGIVRIVQQPRAENDYALIVEFDDNALLGAVTYKVRLTVPRKSKASGQK